MADCFNIKNCTKQNDQYHSNTVILGLILNEKIGWREYDSVGMILIVLFGTVLIIEAISHYIRKKLT